MFTATGVSLLLDPFQWMELRNIILFKSHSLSFIVRTLALPCINFNVKH